MITTDSLYLPNQKPIIPPTIWRSSIVPPPDVAYLILPPEFDGNRVMNWRNYKRSSSFTGATAPTWGLGQNGPLLNFDGANSQVVTLADNIAKGTNFTVAVRVSNSQGNLSSDNPAFGAGDDGAGTNRMMVAYFNYLNTAGNLRCSIGNGTGTIATVTSLQNVWNDGRLHWVHCTYDGANVSLYIDGNYQAQTALTGTVTPLASVIGARWRFGGPENYFTGQVSAVLGWSSIAFSANHVAAHYANPYMWLRQPRKSYLAPSAAVGLVGPLIGPGMLMHSPLIGPGRLVRS